MRSFLKPNFDMPESSFISDMKVNRVFKKPESFSSEYFTFLGESQVMNTGVRATTFDEVIESNPVETTVISHLVRFWKVNKTDAGAVLRQLDSRWILEHDIPSYEEVTFEHATPI